MSPVTSLLKKAISLILQRTHMNTLEAFQANLRSFAVYGTSKRTVFCIDINPIHSHVAFQTCCRPNYFVTE